MCVCHLGHKSVSDWFERETEVKHINDVVTGLHVAFYCMFFGVPVINQLPLFELLRTNFGVKEVSDGELLLL